MMLEDLRVESFSPHVGTAFTLKVGDLEEVFTLREAVSRRERGVAGMRPPFSLIFHGSRTDIMFNQQILPLTHPEMGDLPLFLVPIGRNEDGTVCYQAVFN